MNDRLMPRPIMIENHVFDEIELGDHASVSRTIRPEDIELFSVISGDINPAHLDPEFASTDMFHHIISHGVLTAGLISAVLGTKLPGPGTIYMGQDLQFRAPVSPGDTITATVTVTARDPVKHRLTLDCHCLNQDGVEVIRGTATATVRAGICARLGWLGVEIDGDANGRQAAIISTPASRVVVRVIPTDEETMIAHHCVDLLGTTRPQ